MLSKIIFNVPPDVIILYTETQLCQGTGEIWYSD
jgi:hypothetical protein